MVATLDNHQIGQSPHWSDMVPQVGKVDPIPHRARHIGRAGTVELAKTDIEGGWIVLSLFPEVQKPFHVPAFEIRLVGVEIDQCVEKGGARLGRGAVVAQAQPLDDQDIGRRNR